MQTSNAAQSQLRKDFQRFLYHGSSMMVGNQAKHALDVARTLKRWRELESAGKVRLRAEDEQESYFDVFGDPESYVNRSGRLVSAEQARKEMIETLNTYGNYYCVSEYLVSTECEVEDCECPFHRSGRSDWESADSIGMCAGYRDPLDPFENCYIPDLMQAAIDAYDNAQG